MPYHHYSFAFTSNSQGGSSRLFWFLIGGVAATVYLKVRERHNIWGRGGKEKRVLPECPSCPSQGTRAREQLRPLQVNTETSEAALDVADATLDAAMRIIDGLKQTLGERRSEAGQARIQPGQQASSAGPSRRSRSPSLATSFHHVEGSD